MVRQIQYRKGYKFQLAHSYTVETKIIRAGRASRSGKMVESLRIARPGGGWWVVLFPNGTLYLSGGYAWDGATGAPDFRSVLRAALVHDAFYQLMRRGLLERSWKDAVDLEFRRMLREDTSRVLAATYYRGMRIGTRALKLPGDEPKPVLTAPRGYEQRLQEAR